MSLTNDALVRPAERPQRSDPQAPFSDDRRGHPSSRPDGPPVGGSQRVRDPSPTSHEPARRAPDPSARPSFQPGVARRLGRLNRVAQRRRIGRPPPSPPPRGREPRGQRRLAPRRSAAGRPRGRERRQRQPEPRQCGPGHLPIGRRRRPRGGDRQVEDRRPAVEAEEPPERPQVLDAGASVGGLADRRVGDVAAVPEPVRDVEEQRLAPGDGLHRRPHPAGDGPGRLAGQEPGLDDPPPRRRSRGQRVRRRDPGHPGVQAAAVGVAAAAAQPRKEPFRLARRPVVAPPRPAEAESQQQTGPLPAPADRPGRAVGVEPRQAGPRPGRPGPRGGPGLARRASPWRSRSSPQFNASRSVINGCRERCPGASGAGDPDRPAAGWVRVRCGA